MKVVAKPIDIIVKFKNHNLPEPIKFKYFDSNNKEHVISVEKIQRIETKKIAGATIILYTCHTGGKMYELRFDLRECKWCLFKI